MEGIRARFEKYQAEDSDRFEFSDFLGDIGEETEKEMCKYQHILSDLQRKYMIYVMIIGRHRRMFA